MKPIFLVLICLVSFASKAQNQYAQHWMLVDSLSNNGQSQSALEMVTQIYDRAKTLGQADQFVKASLYRMKLEADFQEDYFEKSIERTLLEIQGAKSPVKQILHSMVAELYWRYYENNRWQIHQRSETSNFQQGDLKTWDLKKIVSACLENYDLSLADKDLLKNTKLSSFSEILVRQKDSEKLRPTLFDFLAYRAIGFYSSSEASLIKPAETFKVNTKEYFESYDQFAAMNIQSQDQFSFEFQALKLYKEVIHFHLGDQDPASLIDADLGRLLFVRQKSTLPEKDSLYLAALQGLEQKFKNHPSSTEIAYQIASQLNNEDNEIIPFTVEPGQENIVSEVHKWDKKRAIEICQAAITRFPESFGAKNCLSLIEGIKLPSLYLNTSVATVIGKPSLALVNYKNVPKIYLRLLKMDPDTDRVLIGKDPSIRLNFYKNLKSLKQWKQDLPDVGDYRNHSAEIKIPALQNGYYVILASTDPTFPNQSAMVTANGFWVSNLSFVSQMNNDGSNEIMILDRHSGQALQGIKVQPFYRNYNSSNRKFDITAGEVYISDQSGKVNIPSKKSDNRFNQFYLLFRSKDDRLMSESNFSSYSFQTTEHQAYLHTYFFTDRAIYRPGQTIYFKGIVLERKGEAVKIKPGQTTEVVLYNNNGQVVSKQNLTTNDFGSFSGSFTAPQGILTGEMTIRNETGNVQVRVEEYKRPKFEVSFEPLKGAYKLGEMLTVKGKASTFAGSKVTDARVKYRVVRQVHFPFLNWNWRGMPRSQEMEITNGQTLTDPDGSFTVSFRAIADSKIDKKNNPVFSYIVFADVADINGESHSTEITLSVGYKSLEIKTDISEDVNLENGFQCSVSTTNLNGEKQASSGTITLWKLRPPKQLLYSRKWQHPDQFVMTKKTFEKQFPGEVYNNEDDVSLWPKDQVNQKKFITPGDSIFKPGAEIKAGMYLLEIKTKDVFGEEITYQKYFNAFQPRSGKTQVVSPVFFALLTPTVEPGGVARILIATPVKKANILVELKQQNNVLERMNLTLDNEQKLISFPVREEHRGNFSINLTMVSNNRSFMKSHQVQVPYSNQKLDIRFATFRNKLLPGQEEEWHMTLSDHKGEKVMAELMAGMYDASLDAFVPHKWPFNILPVNFGSRPWDDKQGFGFSQSNQFYYPEQFFPMVFREYDQLNWFGFGDRTSGRMYKNGTMMVRGIAPMANEMVVADDQPFAMVEDPNKITSVTTLSNLEITPAIKPKNLTVIQVRKNLNETAFFYPQMATNEKGEIVIQFKVPEALTRWKMMGLAHTKDLKYGQIEKTLVTQKDLMIFTNVPRFLREGDQLDFSAKVSNLSKDELSGTAELHFFDAITMQPVDSLMGLNPEKIPFTINKGSSASVNWKIKIPEGLQVVIYRISATAGSFSDGEEAAIPVLTNRMLVTESLPLPVKGLQKKEFIFEKLINSGQSNTLLNYQLSLEFTSNPAWYAVQALPYLMEYPYECAEHIFSRFYANRLASHIVNSDPKIRRIFDSWKNSSPEALKSNLEKNQELKSVLLQESPWVREAISDKERKERIALLFDLNRMASEQTSAMKKLQEMQNSNGGWPWFPGMPESPYITRHIVAGLGHLQQLKVFNSSEDTEMNAMVQKAIDFMDETMRLDFEKIKKEDKNYLKNNHLDQNSIQYLYARSYFLKEFPIEMPYTELIDFYTAQTVKYWKSHNNYLKGMIALYLNMLGEAKTASLVMRSLKETALHNEEMGMYWRNEQRGWHWYQAPVETQALLIEAFDQVSNDQKSVEEMKIWLLKQKQTQDWKTTKATTEAVYALLLRGTSLLTSDQQVEISLGNEKVDPNQQDGKKPEAGTGYFKTNWAASAIRPEMGRITVINPNPTVAWGAMYWQYFEQLDEITPAQTPLSVNKKLFREVNTPTGPVIEPVTENSPVQVGDKMVVRVELRTDRDMEYIHLKDMRASAFEPVDVLSGYHFQEGLGYYQSTLDASTNFFISFLPKGTYVFEYKLTATQKGEFSNGITSVQCMYAPEFSAHSEGIRIKVE